jgi:hypothetical protein
MAAIATLPHLAYLAIFAKMILIAQRPDKSTLSYAIAGRPKYRERPLALCCAQARNP